MSSSRAALTGRMDWNNGDCRLRVENKAAWEVSGMMLLFAGREVLRVHPFVAAAGGTAESAISRDEVRGYFRNYPKLQALLIDEAGRSEVISEIHRKDLISVLG